MFKFVMTKNSLELFHRAVMRGDAKRVRLILEEAMKDPRFNIDDINEEGLTALQFSCFAGNIDIIKMLVSYHANVRIRDRDGYTLLHAASMAGHAEVVKYLLRTGLKPVVCADNGYMPIELAEEISIVVILLRAMLDQGFLKEMQDYMIEHPSLKLNILEELEKVKCMENEKNEILKELPYTSRTVQRKTTKPDRFEKLKNHGNLGRSKSTFSELSTSMQYLDKILSDDYENNNEEKYRKEPIYEEVRERPIAKNVTLRRNDSTCSTSSRSSRASYYSTGSGGILRNNHDSQLSHQNVQRYLENRYPTQKSVSFDLHDNEGLHSYSDGYMSDHLSHEDYDHLYRERRAYSDGYLSDNYEETNSRKRNASVSRSSSMSSHTSYRSEQSYRSENGYDCHKNQVDENNPYDNTYNTKCKQAMPTIAENNYENLPLKNDVAPPLPPREPRYIEEQGSEIFDKQLASETDSGIDINETAGRIFALSLDEKQAITPREQQSYSKPIGLYYSNQSQHVSAKQDNDNLPIGSFILKVNGNNATNKYMSWSGRTNQNASQYQPYAAHKRRQTKDDSDIYDHQNGQYSNQERRDFLSYNFDHQPDIML